MKEEWQTAPPSRGGINAEMALATLTFTILPSLCTVFHFNANRILEEIPQR